MQDSDFKRDNLSLKVNHKPNKRVALDFSVRYSNTTINGAGANIRILHDCFIIHMRIAESELCFVTSSIDA